MIIRNITTARLRSHKFDIFQFSSMSLYLGDEISLFAKYFLKQRCSRKISTINIPSESRGDVLNYR